jgi:uroporphyrinogen-III synthase
MGNLAGVRVALLQGRHGDELAGLVRRHGGEPHAACAVQEAALPSGDQVAALIDRLAIGSVDVVVFTTGAAADSLFEEARQLDRLGELTTSLQRAVTVCRGPKPAMALRRQGIPVTVAAGKPYTSETLLADMADMDLRGRGTAVLHYGERNDQLAAGIRALGADLEELCLYEWLLPTDREPLRRLVRKIISGQVDAIAFTAQVQVRHLYAVAEELGAGTELTAALNEKLVVASVAPTCAAALQARGVEPHVIPELSRMGPLIVALGDYVARARRATV